ncbi:ribonuclease [Sphingomonas bacterium]|uniref:ribonuclease n=1 Tax=Sphingomonas bacterium TaxID=1895847 RepID=UPI0015751201|nr:ribonuclease [Sphingomonas bacterium]
MPRWLYEAGIGEARAALVDRGRILEARIEPEGDGPRVGTIAEARLRARADATGRGRVLLADGLEAEILDLPPSLAEGCKLMVEVIREALGEAHRAKPMRVRLLAEGVPAPGPDLLAQIVATGFAVEPLRAAADTLEEHGWSELLEEAASGLVARPSALLHISLTPAMVLIDVDGGGAAAALAVAGAKLAGETIRRFDLAGSIGIDLPTTPARADRIAAAEALDQVLPQPFERTAVNGFGFLQIVRRRTRPSLMERIAADRIGFAARGLLRRAERAGGRGSVELVAAPVVIDRLEANPAWLEELRRRTGTALRLRAEAGRPISAGHAQRDHA